MNKLINIVLAGFMVMAAADVFATSGSVRGTSSGDGSSASFRSCGDSDSYTGTSTNLSGMINTSGRGSEPCAYEDSDGDTMINSWEGVYGLQWDGAGAEDDAYADLDGDGVTNVREYAQDLVADDTDTDGDGYLDGEDPTPNVFDDSVEGGKWSVNATYKGGLQKTGQDKSSP